MGQQQGIRVFTDGAATDTKMRKNTLFLLIEKNKANVFAITSIDSDGSKTIRQIVDTDSPFFLSQLITFIYEPKDSELTIDLGYDYK